MLGAWPLVLGARRAAHLIVEQNILVFAKVAVLEQAFDVHWWLANCRDTVATIRVKLTSALASRATGTRPMESPSPMYTFSPSPSSRGLSGSPSATKMRREKGLLVVSTSAELS